MFDRVMNSYGKDLSAIIPVIILCLTGIPKFHVTAITHRKQAVYPATIVWHSPSGRCMVGKSKQKEFFSPDQNDDGALKWLDMDMPWKAFFHKSCYCADT